MKSAFYMALTTHEIPSGHVPVMCLASALPLTEFEQLHGYTLETWLRHMGWRSQDEQDFAAVSSRWRVNSWGQEITLVDTATGGKLPYNARVEEEWLRAALTYRMVLCQAVVGQESPTFTAGEAVSYKDCVSILIPVTVTPDA